MQDFSDTYRYRVRLRSVVAALFLLLGVYLSGLNNMPGSQASYIEETGSVQNMPVNEQLSSQPAGNLVQNGASQKQTISPKETDFLSAVSLFLADDQESNGFDKKRLLEYNTSFTPADTVNYLGARLFNFVSSPLPIVNDFVIIHLATVILLH